jgi:hypothetical protein
MMRVSAPPLGGDADGSGRHCIGRLVVPRPYDGELIPDDRECAVAFFVARAEGVDHISSSQNGSRSV